MESASNAGPTATRQALAHMLLAAASGDAPATASSLQKPETHDEDPTGVWDAWSQVVAAQQALRTAAHDLHDARCIYFRAFGRGLEDVLDDFYGALCSIERELAADSSLGGAFVWYRTRHYAEALPELTMLAQRVGRPRTSVQWLLNTLFDRESSAAAELRAVYTRLRYHVHQPFFAMLSRWVAFGELTCFSEDFFVKLRKDVELTHARAISSASDDEVSWFDGSAQEDAHALAFSRAELEWQRGFEIDVQCLPTAYISLSTADAALAIGKAVRILRRQQPRDGSAGPDGSDDIAGAAPAPSDATSAPTTLFSAVEQQEIFALMSSLRAAPVFSSVAFTTVINKVHTRVMEAVWRLLVQDGEYLVHIRGMRHYLLLGRGDLFQALLERVAPSGHAAPPLLTASTLMSGPWLAAAASVGIRGEAFALSWLTANLGRIGASIVRPRQLGPRAAARDLTGAPVEAAAAASDSASSVPSVVLPDLGGEDDPCFDHVSLAVYTRGQRWVSAALPAATRPDTMDATGRTSVATQGSAALYSEILRSWFSADTVRAARSDSASDDGRWLRCPRSAVDAYLVGCAEVHSVSSLGDAAVPDAFHDDLHVGELSHVFLNRPNQHAATTSGVWSSQPLQAPAGFCVRAGVLLHFNAFDRAGLAAGGAAATASFALVLTRDRCAVLGAASHTELDVPNAGFGGISNSLVCQFLCKRLDVGDPDADASTHRDNHVRLRIVAAVYGPPGVASGADAKDGSVSADGRSLLASGVLMELAVAPEFTYIDSTLDATMCAVPLHVCMFYTPGDASNREPAFVVSVLDPTRLLESAQPSNLLDTTDQRRGSVASEASMSSAALSVAGPFGTRLRPSQLSAATKILTNASIDLSAVMDFVALAPPGREQVWCAVTAERASAKDGAVRPCVSLQYMDACARSEANDGVRGLVVDYRVAWPLHILLSASQLAALQDVFRLLLHIKHTSLALKDAWAMLMDSFSLTASTGTALPGTRADRAGTALGAPKSRDGVSAPTSGLGGKRSTDSRVHQRAHTRIAVHRMLQPVWLLRSQLAAAIDGLMYHCQVDVIESAFSELVARVQESRDMGGLTRAHNAFIFAVVNGCFLSQPSVLERVERILRLANRFVSLLSSSAGNLSQLLHPHGARPVLTELSAAFHVELRGLIAHVRTSSDGDAGATLVARFSFNDWF